MSSNQAHQQGQPVDQAAYQQLLAEHQELQARTRHMTADSGSLTSNLTSSRALIYNYQSPSTMTVNHASSRYRSDSAASGIGVESYHALQGSGNVEGSNLVSGASAIAGVGLMDTLRGIPKNPAFTSNAANNRQAGPSRQNPRQPPQFAPNYSIKGKGKANAKSGGAGATWNDEAPPKGKPLQFGNDNHCRVHMVKGSALLRASTRFFSEHPEVQNLQIKWLIGKGFSKQIEVYSAYTNDALERSIIRSFGLQSPVGCLEALHQSRAEPWIGQLDLVKYQPNTVELSQDTWPIIGLTSEAVSLVAFFKSVKHAFIFITRWREPTEEQQEEERSWMIEWFNMTKESYIEVLGRFDEDEEPFLKEFMERIAKEDAEKERLFNEYAFNGKVVQQAPQIAVSMPQIDNGLPAFYAPYVNSLVSNAPAPDLSHERDSSPDAETTIRGWTAPRTAAPVAEHLKYRLGRSIQSAILASDTNYRHFENALRQVPVAGRVRPVTPKEEVQDVKPNLDNLEGRNPQVRKRPRPSVAQAGHASNSGANHTIIDIRSPSPEPSAPQPMVPSVLTAAPVSTQTTMAGPAADLQPEGTGGRPNLAQGPSAASPLPDHAIANPVNETPAQSANAVYSETIGERTRGGLRRAANAAVPDV